MRQLSSASRLEDILIVPIIISLGGTGDIGRIPLPLCTNNTSRFQPILPSPPSPPLPSPPLPSPPLAEVLPQAGLLYPLYSADASHCHRDYCRYHRRSCQEMNYRTNPGIPGVKNATCSLVCTGSSSVLLYCSIVALV